MKKAARPTNEEVKDMMESGALITQFQDMIYRIAHNMRNTHPNENFEELVAEGYYGIALYVPGYDPEKAALSTWVYRSAWEQMKSMCINPKTHRDIPTDFTDPIFETPAHEPYLIGLFRELGEDAKCLIDTAIEAPGELQNVIRERAPKSSQRALREYMQTTLCWDDTRLSTAWLEVAECL